MLKDKISEEMKNEEFLDPKLTPPKSGSSLRPVRGWLGDGAPSLGPEASLWLGRPQGVGVDGVCKLCGWARLHWEGGGSGTVAGRG